MTVVGTHWGERAGVWSMVKAQGPPLECVFWRRPEVDSGNSWCGGCWERLVANSVGVSDFLRCVVGAWLRRVERADACTLTGLVLDRRSDSWERDSPSRVLLNPGPRGLNSGAPTVQDIPGDRWLGCPHELAFSDSVSSVDRRGICALPERPAGLLGVHCGHRSATVPDFRCDLRRRPGRDTRGALGGLHGGFGTDAGTRAFSTSTGS